MAATKRPRKKYSPKRNPLAACRYAHFVPKLAVSNEPLKDREVAEISAPYFAFIEALKAGTATEGMFYTACSTHYLYFALLKVFQADTFNADEDTEAAFRIGQSCRNHRHHRQKIHRAWKIYRHGRRTAPVAANRRPLQSRPRNGRVETLRPRHQRIRAGTGCRSAPEAEKTGSVNIIKFGDFKWIANT